MNVNDSAKLLGAIKSTNMEKEDSPQTTIMDQAGSFLSNVDINPIVSNTGSSYTAQNNIQVSSIPNQKEIYDISDTHFDYVSTVRKPYHITSFNIPSTATPGTLLKKISIPGDYFAANHVLTNVGATFRSFAGKFHVLVSVQGSPSYAGSLVVNAKYGTTVMSYATPIEAYQNMCFMQKAILDYSDNSSTADLIVPFRHHLSGTDPFTSVHTIEFRAFAPLAGATSITATVTMFVEDPVFRFLRPQVSSVLEAMAAEGRSTQGLITVTNINNTMRDISDSTLPLNLKGDALDLNPSLMDAVPIALNPNPMLVKYNSFNNSDNPFPVDRMSTNASTQRISDRTTFGTTEDEMDIKEITSRDNFIATFDLTTSTAINASVFSTFVTPSRLWSTDLFSSPLTVLASNYKYWRGGLKYKFRFYMNRFQSIKLYAAMFYKDSEPLILSDWSASHGVTLDIGGDQREVEIEIPYNAETSWLYNPTKTPQDLTSTIQKYVLGKIALYAITPLVSPTGSPTSIKCVVSVSTSDDFELAAYQPVSSRAQGILLSEKSLRKPNDIVDCSPSIKSIMKRYYGFSNSFSEVNVDKYYVMADLLYPGGFRLNTGTDAVSTGDNVHLKFPFNSNIPISRFYEGFRGGITMRVTMNYIYREATYRHALVPFCLFLPKTEITVGTTTLMNAMLASLNKYFNVPFSADNALTTPFVALPINATAPVQPGQDVVFEIDCPFQPVEKYARMAYSPFPQITNGLIIVGFWDPKKGNYGAETLVDINIRTALKFSDDARLGILELGSHAAALSGNDNWTSNQI